MVKTIISAITLWAKDYFKQSDWNEANSKSTAYIKHKPVIPTVPNKLSQLTNDTNYITLDDVPDNGDKMDKENPSGTGTFSLNRKSGSTIGNRSFAEGDSTVASGNYSHAEGYNTVASGLSSHAEGWGAIIGSTASGNSSHAEGDSTVASGNSSHAEGDSTTASGNSSHAEGYGTTASGVSSHAEGYGVKSLGNYSHAQGKFNIRDTSNKYAHIVGNGTDYNESKRSNAHTLDWEGNAWFSGDVYVGSTSGINKDEGSVKLAKITDIPTQITDEHINQLIDTKLTPIETIADEILGVI